LNELLGWLEASALGEAVRGAGVWSYGVINAAHILGVATLFGAILVLDLRLIGFGRHRNVSDIAGATVPVAATGLALAVITGVCLLATNGSEYSGNPFLPIKFAAIGVGALNLAVLHRLRGWRAVRDGQPVDASAAAALRAGGAVSLASWITAVVAGRMLGYW
jgi:formate-dependent nitrite reductase membrane component NrfD